MTPLRLTPPPVPPAAAAVLCLRGEPGAGPGGRDRRRFRRTPLHDRVGLRGEGVDAVADLIDGSAGGLFLRIDGGRRPAAGDAVVVAFSAGGRGGPARADHRRRTTVVRCLSHAGTHYAALRFATPDALRIHARFG